MVLFLLWLKAVVHQLFSCLLLVSFFFFRWMSLALVLIRRGTGTTTGRRTRWVVHSRRRASITQTTSTISHSSLLRKAKSGCLKASSLRPAGSCGYRRRRNDLEKELHSAHSLSKDPRSELSKWWGRVLLSGPLFCCSAEIQTHNLLGSNK